MHYCYGIPNSCVFQSNAYANVQQTEKIKKKKNNFEIWRDLHTNIRDK